MPCPSHTDNSSTVPALPKTPIDCPLAIAPVMPSMPATQIARNQGAMLHAADLQHHRGRIAR